MQDEKKAAPGLLLSNAPHIHAGQSLRSIMWLVVLAWPRRRRTRYISSAERPHADHRFGGGMRGGRGGLCFLIKNPSPSPTVRRNNRHSPGLQRAARRAVVDDRDRGRFAVIVAKQLFGGIGFNYLQPGPGRQGAPHGLVAGAHDDDVAPLGPTNILSQAASNVAGPRAGVRHHHPGHPARGPERRPEAPGRLGVAPEPCTGRSSPPRCSNRFHRKHRGCVGETSALLLLVGGFSRLQRIVSWHIRQATSARSRSSCSPITRLRASRTPPGRRSSTCFPGDWCSVPSSWRRTWSPRRHAAGHDLFGSVAVCSPALYGCGADTRRRFVLDSPDEFTVPLIDRLTRPKVFGRSTREGDRLTVPARAI